METAASSYRLRDLFWDALAIEGRVVRGIFNSIMTLFADILCLFLGISMWEHEQ